jgi:hypothetical protein
VAGGRALEASREVKCETGESLGHRCPERGEGGGDAKWRKIGAFTKSILKQVRWQYWSILSGDKHEADNAKAV